MPHSQSKSKKSAAGVGSIRKKTVLRRGKEYTYWEARQTAGFDPNTGKQLQRSISGKTQKEVAQKLKAVTAAIDAGTYSEPCQMTVGEWLDIWTHDYLGNIKPNTATVYLSVINTHIKPGIGMVKLETLTPYSVQCFYNSLGMDTTEKKDSLPKPSRMCMVFSIKHYSRQSKTATYEQIRPMIAAYPALQSRI